MFAPPNSLLLRQAKLYMKKHLLLSTIAAAFAMNASAQCLTISCNGNVTTNNDSASCGAIVNYGAPSVVSNTCPNIAATDTFNFSGAMQTYVVPPGVTTVTIETWGAQGGANWVNNTNFGGYVKGDVAVTPGSTLYIFVGGQPTTTAGGYNGGGAGDGVGKGGGGGTDVRIGGTTYNDRVVVAGGGGGAGYWSSLHVVGGVGGGLTGGNGYRDSPANPGGLGGSQTGPGANGTCISLNNTTMAGGFGYGGTPLSFSCGCEGYGGGGGWYGGAGSGNCRGGGGGSGYAIPTATNVVLNSGVRVGNGKVVISYAGPSTVTYTQISGLPSGSLFPIGTTTNTMVGSAGLGNSDTCSFAVTVIDNQSPVLSSMPSSVSVSADSGMCSAIGSWNAPVASDNCTSTVTSNYMSGAAFPVGTTTVLYSVTDPSGNSDTASFTVTVIDGQQPVFVSTPTEDTLYIVGNSCAASATWTAPIATDNCGILSVTSNFTSGDTLPVGTTTVTYTALDSANNSTTASFNIVVLDTVAPVLNCPANITVGTDSGQCSASNVSLGVVGIIESCTVTSSTNDAPPIFPVGTTSVNYIVVDASGNMATCSQQVTVVDNEAPVFADCPQNISMCPGVVTYSMPTATDNCLAIVSHVSGPLSGGSLNAGTYPVIYVANDSTGNTDTCSFTITVNANPVVTLSLTSSTVCVNDGPYTLSGASPAGGTWSGTAVSSGVFTPATAGIGSYVISYNVTDANGCSGVATDSITVSPCTGINEIGTVTFSMFPNPASGSFVFNASEDGTMEMFDVNGQLVYTSTITADKTEINVSNLSTGSYMVRFTSEQGSISSGKLLIQR